MKKRFLVALWLCGYVALWLVATCSAQEKPDLTIVSPKEKETIFGDTVSFSFVASNFILGVDGYLRISLDKKEPTLIKNQEIISLSGLAEGKHALVAELIDKKRRFLSTEVKKEVAFFSVLPEEKGINLKISPPEEEGTENLWLLSAGFFGLAAVVFSLVVLKLYINTKTRQDRSGQKPLS